MKKKLLRILGITLLVCGIVIYAIAAKVQEKTRGSTIRFGTVINSQFQETDRSVIGRNPEGEKDMGYLKGIGVMSCVMGAGITVGSFFVKEEEEPQY